MYPESYYDDDRVQQKPRNPLTLDIYPSKREKTRFELFEDDGLTYRFKTDSMYNKTLIECDPKYRSDAISIKVIGQYEGKGYKGMPKKRNYYLKVHGNKPKKIFIEMDKLFEMNDSTELDKVEDGWYFETDKNIAHIKVKKQEAKSSFNIYAIKGSP